MMLPQFSQPPVRFQAPTALILSLTPTHDHDARGSSTKKNDVLPILLRRSA